MLTEKQTYVLERIKDLLREVRGDLDRCVVDNKELDLIRCSIDEQKVEIAMEDIGMLINGREEEV